jgi:hypothetical protein
MEKFFEDALPHRISGLYAISLVMASVSLSGPPSIIVDNK